MHAVSINHKGRRFFENAIAFYWI